MTPWHWWWLEGGDDGHGGWRGEFGSREQAIAAAGRELPEGTTFHVMEARSSTAMKHEGSECVPFLPTRNRATLVTGVRVHDPRR